MRRLVWGFAGSTYHIVENLMRWLKFIIINTLLKYLTLWLKYITLCLLVSSADNFYKQIGTRSGLTDLGLGSSCMILWWYFWKNFSKKLILIKISRRQKNNMEIYFCGWYKYLYDCWKSYLSCTTSKLWSWRNRQMGIRMVSYMRASTRENLSSGVCEQHSRRPACASAQSDQRLCYSLVRKYHV